MHCPCRAVQRLNRLRQKIESRQSASDAARQWVPLLAAEQRPASAHSSKARQSCGVATHVPATKVHAPQDAHDTAWRQSLVIIRDGVVAPR